MDSFEELICCWKNDSWLCFGMSCFVYVQNPCMVGGQTALCRWGACCSCLDFKSTLTCQSILMCGGMVMSCKLAGGHIRLSILLFDSCGTWEHETDLKPLALGRAEGSFTKCGFVLEQNADSLGRLPWRAETKKGTFFHSPSMDETSFGHLLLHTPFLADSHASKFHNQPTKTNCKPNHVPRLPTKTPNLTERVGSHILAIIPPGLMAPERRATRWRRWLGSAVELG